MPNGLMKNFKMAVINWLDIKETQGRRSSWETMSYLQRYD